MFLRDRKRVIVTGGAGFLGSHLCERLLKNDCEVLCVDNLYSGSKENISHLLLNSNFEFIRHDITFPLYLEADEIFNLACPASPLHYQRNPVETIKTCVHGSINMLGLAKRINAPILQASTSEVYGDPEFSPQKEDYWGRVNPIGVRSCYDEGKRSAETLFFDYNRQHNLDIKVVRIFNTYGPRMLADDGRVMSNFIVQALGGDDLTIYGDGSQTRSFCFVDDIIDGFIKMMETDPEIKGPINLGNPFEIKIVDLAKKIIDRVGHNSKLIFKTLPENDPRCRRPDISNAQRDLNWSPTIDLEEGLDRTIEYYRKNLKI